MPMTGFRKETTLLAATDARPAALIGIVGFWVGLALKLGFPERSVTPVHAQVYSGKKPPSVLRTVSFCLAGRLVASRHFFEHK